MRNHGFTLVELTVVIAIMAILTSLATVSWNSMQRKAAIESEARTMYADLMAIRLEALYRKQTRKVSISGTSFLIYSTATITSTPQTTKRLTYPVVSNLSGALSFDAQGLMNGNERSFCILPTNDTTIVNPGAIDSIVVSAARVNLGKRTGGDCATGNIDQK